MSEIERISPLVKKACDVTASIASKEEELKEEKAALRKLLDIEIPELMTELGLTSVTADNGRMVKIVPFIDARIVAAKIPAAHAWLREHNFGDLIKHVVTTAFGAGEEEDAKAVKLYLEEQHMNVVDKESVHPQTLKAWARERDENGEEIPEDIFGIYRGTTTKIT